MVLPLLDPLEPDPLEPDPLEPDPLVPEPPEVELPEPEEPPLDPELPLVEPELLEPPEDPDDPELPPDEESMLPDDELPLEPDELRARSMHCLRSATPLRFLQACMASRCVDWPLVLPAELPLEPPCMLPLLLPVEPPCMLPLLLSLEPPCMLPLLPPAVPPGTPVAGELCSVGWVGGVDGDPLLPDEPLLDWASAYEPQAMQAAATRTEME